jgi:polysaccharide pyruvyl transferase WcaK-like protein
MTKRALLLNDTSLAGNYGSHLVVRQLLSLAGRHGIEIAHRHRLSVDRERLSLDGIDLVIVNGEGSLHDSSKAARAIAASARWAEDRGLPAFLVNTIYQNNDAEVLEGVRRFRRIYTRDRQSFQELEALGQAPAMTTDLALTWQPESLPAEGRATIVVTDSALRDKNQALFEASERLADGRFLPLRAKPPAEQGQTFGNLAKRLRYRARKLIAPVQASDFERARLGNSFATFEDFTGWLSDNARLLIAGRHHAVCLAIDMRIPFVAVSTNSWKTEALLDEVGLMHRLFDQPIDRLAERDLVAEFGTYTEEELDRIDALTTRQRQLAEAMFEEIRDLSG